MAKSVIPPKELLYPTPVVLVSSLHPSTRKPNIITIAWCGIVCSEPPQISISIRPSRFSHAIIAKTGEFVINIPTASQLVPTDLCGIRSGRDTDKFALCGFTPEPATHVAAPLIRECPVNIECRVKEARQLGVHDMFIGEVLEVHIDDAVRSRDGKVDLAKAPPIAFANGDYWNLGSRIGFYGFSAKQ